MSTNEYIRGVKSIKFPPFEKYLRQRNYYEHVIRNTADYERIYGYIDNNPFEWKTDELYSEY